MAHNQLGHMEDQKTKSVAKSLVWQLEKGEMGPCEACAAGKARLKNIKKEAVKEPTKDAFLEVSMLKPKNGMPNKSTPHWRIVVVDPKVQIKISHFFETKKGMAEPTCKLFQQMKNRGVGITHLRMESAGENNLLEQQCNSKDWKHNIEIEYTTANFNC
jgi:hypothetical protein